MTPLAKLLEAALFASAHPISFEDLARLDSEASPAGVTAALDEIRDQYNNNGHGIEIVEVAEGYQILTRPEYTEAIENAQIAHKPSRLSAAALETLAIIAYRQPIGRAEIEEIRGVSAGAILKSLHERELVDVVGRAEGLGRPLLYGTTLRFLEQFGLRHLGELPRADELTIALRRAGGIEENVEAPLSEAAGDTSMMGVVGIGEEGCEVDPQAAADTDEVQIEDSEDIVIEASDDESSDELQPVGDTTSAEEE